MFYLFVCCVQGLDTFLSSFSLCARVSVYLDIHVCLISFRLPNAFALNSTHSMVPSCSAAEGGNSSPVDTDTLKIEEVQAPATGTRKAKVLYDYDAADSSELSLLADEVSFPHTHAESKLCKRYS